MTPSLESCFLAECCKYAETKQTSKLDDDNTLPALSLMPFTCFHTSLSVSHTNNRITPNFPLQNLYKCNCVHYGMMLNANGVFQMITDRLLCFPLDELSLRSQCGSWYVYSKSQCKNIFLHCVSSNFPLYVANVGQPSQWNLFKLDYLKHSRQQQSTDLLKTLCFQPLSCFWHYSIWSTTQCINLPL